ncbi:glycosyltransferase [Aurantiacibacter poecillastricola]|uniref:glycosyltransferase n=1 Tax=Aurantiacibacter poecillastricola TaxID=3064385 RepID=UPI00273EF0DD|nr:glycosyltransferase [Aurantiacibacter sp. 219JJ12-13]MDP5263218.1 glycosyltransferase [Aurantiacibacter sp. 219JJ12-13]
MRILLTTAHPYLPEIAGGAQSSIHQMALALQQRDHEVAVLSGLAGKGIGGLRNRVALKLGGNCTVRDRSLGYRTYRGWFAWDCVAEVVADFAPDVAVPHSGFPVRMSEAFARADVPVAIYFRNVEMDDFGGDPAGAAKTCIANSSFTADRLKCEHGIEAEVIPPLFDAARYSTSPSRKFVTFINPHPEKGRDLAFAIARLCPDLEFLFVRAWTLDAEDEEKLQSIERECANVTVMEKVSDMRTVYGLTAVMLVPSRWDEAWGRIATEAHFSGIPVVAAKVGGLPESVGPGGILLDRDADASQWAAALQDLLGDPAKYEGLSRRALDYSRRSAIDPDRQLDQFVECLGDAIDKHRRASPQHQREVATSLSGID